jgi:hypothetical protein
MHAHPFLGGDGMGMVQQVPQQGEDLTECCAIRQPRQSSLQG